MSDLQSTLDAIDQLAVHECGWCQHPLAEDGPSPDFCNERCQEQWAAQQQQIVELTPAPPQIHRPLNIHVLPRPSCTCTMCSHPAVQPATAEPEPVVVTVAPDLSEFRQALARAGRAIAAMAGIPAELLGWRPEPYRPELEHVAWTPRRHGLTEYMDEIVEFFNADQPLGNLGISLNDANADPVDETPQERALRLRRTRNTGPQQRQRAPRRIDARRSR